MGQLNSRLRVFTGIYDFAIDGGAIGTINLKVPLQANSIIQGYSTKVLTAMTSGGAATVAFGVTSVATNSIIAATAYNAVNYAINVVGAGTPLPTAAAVPSTGGSLTMTIAVAALTAGKVVINLVVLELDV